MNCLSLVQGFFIYPFTFGVLGCGEASRGKRCALPSRNSRKSLGEARWEEQRKHRCLWLPSMGVRLSALRKPIEHCSESLWFKTSLLDSQCTNSSLIAKGTWLLDPGLILKDHHLFKTVFISAVQKESCLWLFRCSFQCFFDFIS